MNVAFQACVGYEFFATPARHGKQAYRMCELHERPLSGVYPITWGTTSAVCFVKRNRLQTSSQHRQQADRHQAARSAPAAHASRQPLETSPPSSSSRASPPPPRPKRSPPPFPPESPAPPPPPYSYCRAMLAPHHEMAALPVPCHDFVGLSMPHRDLRGIIFF